MRRLSGLRDGNSNTAAATHRFCPWGCPPGNPFILRAAALSGQHPHNGGRLALTALPGSVSVVNPGSHLAVRERLVDRRWSGRRVLLSARFWTRGSGTGTGRYIAVASASTLPQASTVGLLASRSIPAGAANRRLSSFECHSNPLGVTSPFAAVPGNRHPDFQHPSCRPFCPFFTPFAVP